MRFIGYFNKDDVTKNLINNNGVTADIKSIKETYISLKIPLISNRFSYIFINIKNLEEICGIFVLSNKDIHKSLEIILESYIYIGELNSFKNKYRKVLSKNTIDLINKLNKTNKLIKYKDFSEIFILN